MLSNGASVPDIQRAIGCGRSTAIKLRQEARKALRQLEHYTTHRQEALALGEQVMLRSTLDPAKVASATLRDCAMAFKVFHESNRLERGESTSNVAHLHKLAPVDYGMLNDDGDSVPDKDTYEAPPSEAESSSSPVIPEEVLFDEVTSDTTTTAETDEPEPPDTTA